MHSGHNELKTKLNNFMFVLIKLDKYDAAIEEGPRAMEIDPNNCKTNFRLV